VSRRVREHEVVHSAPQLVPNDGVAAEQSRRVRLEGTHIARRPAPSEPLKIGHVKRSVLAAKPLSIATTNRGRRRIARSAGYGRAWDRRRAANTEHGIRAAIGRVLAGRGSSPS
jgi:hypothetical protein